jgi:hypothetical protein
MFGRSTLTMNRIGKFLLVAFGVVVLLIASLYIYIARPINDGRTPAERQQIADACFAMLHSSLTNDVDDIKMDDPRIPAVIRALHPHHIEVIPNFAVDIYRTEWPQEYFLMRSHSSNTWVLYVDGPSLRFGGGGREILRIGHD